MNWYYKKMPSDFRLLFPMQRAEQPHQTFLGSCGFSGKRPSAVVMHVTDS